VNEEALPHWGLSRQKKYVFKVWGSWGIKYYFRAFSMEEGLKNTPVDGNYVKLN